MTISEQLDKIAQRIVESGAKVPDCALLGIDAYKALKKEVMDQCFSTSNQLSEYGYHNFSMYIANGRIDIKVKPELDPNHISIGRITLMDFYIEDVLLGEEDIDFSNYN